MSLPPFPGVNGDVPVGAATRGRPDPSDRVESYIGTRKIVPEVFTLHDYAVQDDLPTTAELLQMAQITHFPFTEPEPTSARMLELYRRARTMFFNERDDIRGSLTVKWPLFLLGFMKLSAQKFRRAVDAIAWDQSILPENREMLDFLTVSRRFVQTDIGRADFADDGEDDFPATWQFLGLSGRERFAARYQPWQQRAFQE